jgi:hypothetical protein
MRQLAKSALSLGWALSLLGAKQAYSIVAKENQSNGDDLGRVTQTAVDQLDESLKRIHRSTNTMESRMVDMAFSFMNPTRWVNPQSWNLWKTPAGCGQEAKNTDQSTETENQAANSD